MDEIDGILKERGLQNKSQSDALQGHGVSMGGLIRRERLKRCRKGCLAKPDLAIVYFPSFSCHLYLALLTFSFLCFI